jgi:hypothetical protein
VGFRLMLILHHAYTAMWLSTLHLAHLSAVAAVRLKDQSTGATVPLLAVGAALPAGRTGTAAAATTALLLP